jgi:hypothetical protein
MLTQNSRFSTLYGILGQNQYQRFKTLLRDCDWMGEAAVRTPGGYLTWIQPILSSVRVRRWIDSMTSVEVGAETVGYTWLRQVDRENVLLVMFYPGIQRIT